MNTFSEYYLIQESAIDAVQAALDIAGVVPAVGAPADAANTLISLFRSALAKTTDERKRHILNAGISAIAMIPFAGLINLLKLRKVRPVAKLAVQGARKLKTYGRVTQAAGRFNQQQPTTQVAA